MTKTEHIEWCKKRASGFLPTSPSEAVWSMMCDLRLHCDTEHYTHDAIIVKIAGHSINDPVSAKNFIDQF